MCKFNPFFASNPIPKKATNIHRLLFAISYASRLWNVIMGIEPSTAWRAVNTAKSEL